MKTNTDKKLFNGALEDIKGRLTIASAEVLNDNVIEELKHNDKIVHRVFYK